MIHPDFIIDPVEVKLLELSMSLGDSPFKGLSLLDLLKEKSEKES